MLKVGIVGSGFGTYGLLPAFGQTKNCQVQCVCAKQSQRLVKYCKKYKVKKIYQNWREMLEQESLDAIAIAVTPSAQYEIAKYAIKKGLHIFAEKPLAENLKHSNELYTLSKKKKITTALDFIFPEIPEWVKAKQLLKKKYLGKLLNITADWKFFSYDLKHKLKTWKTDSNAGGGASSFYFSHVLYYLEYFAGEFKELNSRLSYSKLSLGGGESGVDILFKTQLGVSGTAHLDASFAGQLNHRLTFLCQKGEIILENKKNVALGFSLKIFQKGKIRQIEIKKSYPTGQDERVVPVKRIAQRFVNGIFKKKQIKPSIIEGLRVQKLIKKINDQAKKY